MPLIENPASALVTRLTGVHLFGFDAAPCSQRVACALAEKGLRRLRTVRWNDTRPRQLVAPPGTYLFREVSLVRQEHLSAEYAAIQPNMVVPALVEDGRLYIESMDIIGYLDQTRPEPMLVPDDAARAALVHELIEQGKALHVSVRYVSFHWGLGRLGKLDAATEGRLRTLERDGSPEQLVAFYSGFNHDAIDAAEYLRHLRALEAGYAAQEARLAGDARTYLTGETFTMADILWCMKVMRIMECGYPFASRYPALSAWFERVRARPAFRAGVMRHHRFLHRLFRAKATMERWLGGGIARAAAS
ncbi:MAG: glutathione S-transferase family protein [Gammaproteobacteria bacterium]